MNETPEPCLHRIHVLKTSQVHKQLNKQLMPTVSASRGNTKETTSTQGRAPDTHLVPGKTSRTAMAKPVTGRKKELTERRVRAGEYDGGSRGGPWREAGCRSRWRRTLWVTSKTTGHYPRAKGDP